MLGYRNRHVLLVAGAGFSRPIGRKLMGHAQLVGGTHWFHVDEADGPGWQSHVLPTAGVRVGVHRFGGVGRILAFGTVEATVGS
jgi:hypothetical protein